MSGLKEISIAIARIVLGIVVLIEGLTASAFIFYTGTIDGVYDKTVAAAYEDSYDKGYVQAYEVGYQEAYGEAYDKGYAKGYEIGLETGSKEGVATRVELRNPTDKEMREFLAGDETDSNPYVVDEYVSFDFAVELNNHAEANEPAACNLAEFGHRKAKLRTPFTEDATPDGEAHARRDEREKARP